jgi:energy-coupling factor transporter ATP-binding protein EcfA2
MSRAATPPVSLQESILATLLFSEKAGVLAGLVEVKHFDDPYRNVASAALDYYSKFKKPPGRAHLDDLFAVQLADRNSPVRRILLGLVDLVEGLNVEYVISRVQVFVRDQRIKAALIEANSRYEVGGDEETRAEEIETIFSDALRERVGPTFDPIFANQDRILDFLTQVDKNEGYSLGISQFDDLGLRLKAKELLLFLAPKGIGKSWFCNHVGKKCIEQGAKVAHLTLENSKEITAQRYFQSFFNGALTNEDVVYTKLRFKDGWLVGRERSDRKKPAIAFNDPRAKRLLREEMKWWGLRLGNLVIEQYPSGRLTVRQVESWLDFLESNHNFIPNVLIIDYPRLMRMSADNLRIDIGQTFVELRGIAVSRNLALVCPHQGNRSTIGARRTRSKEAGEDISVIQTADTTVSMSRTDAEEALGLARLSVEHSRNTPGGIEIVITQSYATGQFIRESAKMTREYWDEFKAEEARLEK